MANQLPEGYERDGRCTYLTAWGERKRLSEWMNDERCQVENMSTLSTRILTYGQTPEEAMTRPIGGTDRPRRTLTIGSETKTLSEWMRDPRCKIRSRATLKSRIESGWRPEDVIGLPEGCTPETALEAFGEIRSYAQWAKDERCTVGLDALKKRVANGMSPEEAITLPSGYKLAITAFGETKLPSEWEKDPRCLVAAVTITNRIKRLGMSPEEAIERPPAGGTKLSAAELFERELQIGAKFHPIRVDLIAAAAEAIEPEVQYSNQYQLSQTRFCFGIWTEVADIATMVATMCELAYTDDRFAGQASSVLAWAAAPKNAKSVGSGVLLLSPGWWAVEADGRVWRGSEAG